MANWIVFYTIYFIINHNEIGLLIIKPTCMYIYIDIEANFFMWHVSSPRWARNYTSTSYQAVECASRRNYNLFLSVVSFR